MKVKMERHGGVRKHGDNVFTHSLPGCVPSYLGWAGRLGERNETQNNITDRSVREERGREIKRIKRSKR